MTKKQEATIALGVALVGGAVAHRVAAKQAAVLGIPALVLAVLGWMVSEAIG